MALAALPDTKKKLCRGEILLLAVTPVPASSSFPVGFWIIYLMSCNSQLSSLNSEKNILTAAVCAMRIAKKNLSTIWKQIA